jgi:hypothetical protein
MASVKGRVPRGVERALRALGQATTAELTHRCYRDRGDDRFTRKNRSRWVRKVCERMAIKLGRVWPYGNVWRLKAEYQCASIRPQPIEKIEG